MGSEVGCSCRLPLVVFFYEIYVIAFLEHDWYWLSMTRFSSHVVSVFPSFQIGELSQIVS